MRTVDEDLAGKLAPILQRVGKDLVWRPIVDREGRTLVRGAGKLPDIAPETLDEVDFRGKSVLDLGCNFGCYSFLAARRGAASVLGVDISPEVIEGCEVLRRHYALPNLSFRAADFLKEDLGGPFDIVLLVDFIGRGIVGKGKLRAVLDALQRSAAKPGAEILMSFHEEYSIAEELPADEAELARLYPQRFIDDGRFRLFDYVSWSFGDDWLLRRAPTSRSKSLGLKTPVIVRRLARSN